MCLYLMKLNIGTHVCLIFSKRLSTGLHRGTSCIFYYKWKKITAALQEVCKASSHSSTVIEYRRLTNKKTPCGATLFDWTHRGKTPGLMVEKPRSSSNLMASLDYPFCAIVTGLNERSRTEGDLRGIPVVGHWPLGNAEEINGRMIATQTCQKIKSSLGPTDNPCNRVDEGEGASSRGRR